MDFFMFIINGKSRCQQKLDQYLVARFATLLAFPNKTHLYPFCQSDMTMVVSLLRHSLPSSEIGDS